MCTNNYLKQIDDASSLPRSLNDFVFELDDHELNSSCIYAFIRPPPRVHFLSLLTLFYVFPVTEESLEPQGRALMRCESFVMCQSLRQAKAPCRKTATRSCVRVLSRAVTPSSSLLLSHCPGALEALLCDIGADFF